MQTDTPDIQPPADMALPPIIQGGMGVGVSSWTLARAVSRRGMLGVISGTGIDQVFTRRLQLGDPSGNLRRAVAAFPCRQTADRVLARYFVEGGKEDHASYRTPAMPRFDSSPEHWALVALSSFVEVWLAKEGHDGVVGINLLEKIALPNPALLYGAMLAGVDYVLMGAGIPWQIPGILDTLARREKASLFIPLEDDPAGGGEHVDFDPSWLGGDRSEPLKRPRFLAIVSSPTICQALLKRATGRIDGFVVEGWTAGGHNAPPRGKAPLNERGEPVYGERDTVDLGKLRGFGLPFWLAGGMGDSGALARSQAEGAVGIQVGTLFAFCRESGLDPVLRTRALEALRKGEADVFTDPLASPTGFPFKVIRLASSLSESKEYDERGRVCDVGQLRRAYRKPDGGVGYRCPSESECDYIAKGGEAEDTAGRKCLCNALIANIGLGQIRKDGTTEGILLTAGDELLHLTDVMGDRIMDYSADDVLGYLLGIPAPSVSRLQPV